MGSLVTYQREEHCVRLDLDDGKLNILSPAMLAELHAALARAETEGVPLVLSGREGAFSAGFDLKVLRGGGSDAADLFLSGFRVAERLLSFPAPVIVVCTGHAIAMGLFVALAGDLRIGAAGRYRMTANEVAMGMTLPRTAIEICRHRLVPGLFDRVVLLSEVFSPEQALVAGMLDRLVTPEELDRAVDELICSIAALDMAAHRNTKLRGRAGLLSALAEAIAADDNELRLAFG